MSETPVKVIGRRLLVKLKEPDKSIISTPELTERAKDEITEGTIVSKGVLCGDEFMADSLQEFPEVGAQVIFIKYCGTNKEINGSTYRLLKDSEIICEVPYGPDIPLIPLIPLGPRMLLEVEKVEEKSKGGIILTSTYVSQMQDCISEGTILAYSASCAGDNVEARKELPLVGTKVLYVKYSGFQHDIGDKSYRVVNDEDVYGMPTKMFYEEEAK